MERAGEWRLLDSDEPDDNDDQAGTEPSRTRDEETLSSTRWLVALVATVVLSVAGIAIWLTMPQPDVRLEVAGGTFQFGTGALSAASPGAYGAAPSTLPALIVVDVEGAIQRPGLHRLAAASRVGDAIAAAGGYSPAVDIAAAAAQLNLAAPLVDGAKIHVPVLGDASATHSVPGATTSSSGSNGLIDINQATAVELETLPGIGEVTAAEIIAAREEALFVSIDDLIGRGIVGPATMEKIRELISVTP